MPRALGRYEIQDEIGRGTMGVIYRANDPALGRTVALKTIDLAKSLAGAERQAFEKRFQAEARAAAGLSHAGIVVVHDFGRDEATGTLFIAFEHLQGRTLAARMAEGAPFEWRAALRLVARVAEALDHAHARGVVHRDIKPANVMLLPSGNPKVLDFGVAKVPQAQLTAHGEFFGTPLYMSPEQTAGQAVDRRSDLFSLGALLYLLLTGRPAFDADTVPGIFAKVLHHEPDPPSRVVAGIPPAVDLVVAHCLAKRPEERHSSGGALAEDLEDLIAGRAPRHTPGTPASRAAAPPAAPEPPAVPPLPAASEPRTAPREAAAPARFLAEPPPLTSPPGGAAHRRRMVALGAVGVALAAYVALEQPWGLSAPGPAPPAAKPPVREEQPNTASTSPDAEEPGLLRITLQHRLRSGRLRVFIDEEKVLDERLTSRVTRKLLVFEERKGRLRETLEVPPGEHTLRVQVVSGERETTRRIPAEFRQGLMRHLDVDVGSDVRAMKLEWLAR